MTGTPDNPPPGNTPPLRVLVADDQATVREGLVTLLGLAPGIAVVGAAADGAQTFENQAAGWYVLAGGERAFEIAIPPADCRRTKTISVVAKTERDAWKASFAVAPEACEPAPR